MIGKLQRSTVSKSQGTNMINKLGWITNTKSGQRPDPFMESKNLNEEGCLQWRCTLWIPLSGQPLEKRNTVWIKAKDFSDYSGKDWIIGVISWITTNDVSLFTREKERICDQHFSQLLMNAPSTRFFVTNFLLGAMILLENACCTFSRNNFCLKTLAA